MKVCLTREWNSAAPTCRVPGRESSTRTGATGKYVAPDGSTRMPLWVPVRLALAVSVAVMELVPVVARVTLNVCRPLSAAVKA